jgi:arylsulfatase
MPNGKPNVLFIMGDDIGWFNPSCYNSGMMGYRTPNIDRIAEEGMLFTDAYGEPSRFDDPASRAAARSVLDRRISPTVAQLLKPLGYATGQFGKSHFGDLDRFLPTVHGFDEFFGTLYLFELVPDAGEPLGPRGVLRWGTERVDSTVQPRWDDPNEQSFEDGAPRSRRRKKCLDDEFIAAATDWLIRQHAAARPFCCWVNTTPSPLRGSAKRSGSGASRKPRSRGRQARRRSCRRCRWCRR